MSNSSILSLISANGRPMSAASTLNSLVAAGVIRRIESRRSSMTTEFAEQYANSVVMLDRRLSIRRITPAATKLFKVLAADIGRPFADIKLNIEELDITSHDLELEITKVL